MATQGAKQAEFSIPSIIAVIAAILSFMTGALWGFILAIVAIICGIIGVILSLSPQVRGGFASIFGLGAGVLGMVAAFIRAIMWLTGAGA
jgi:hypothetical protein